MEHVGHAANVDEKRCPECSGILQVLDEWEICESCGRTCYDKNKQNKKPYKNRPEPVRCGNCGNVYRIEWLVVGIDWNDFGDRYCPYCGDHTSIY